MDIFDNGTPKYSTAQDIYESLEQLTLTEEMSILSEMFADVSYDNQGYYYTDKGYELKVKYDELIEYGNKTWIMDLALYQLNNNNTEIHDIVYQALCNSDMAKRLGFKKLFVEHMLRGDGRDYAVISEAFLDELSELNRFENYEMIKAFNRVLNNREMFIGATPYPSFAYALHEKVCGLILQKEVCVISECRALLTSYDDFMLGLRMNQALYERQEQLYRDKAAMLQQSYDEKVRLLMARAESMGLLEDMIIEPLLLEE